MRCNPPRRKISGCYILSISPFITINANNKIPAQPLYSETSAKRLFGKSSLCLFIIPDLERDHHENRCSSGSMLLTSIYTKKNEIVLTTATTANATRK
jgi:hypothetical protein